MISKIRFILLVAGIGFAPAAWADCSLPVATYDLVSQPLTVSCLSGTGTITNSEVGTATFTVTPGGTSADVFSGSIEDGVGKVTVVKAGAGILTLSGTGTYSGDTGLLSPANIAYYGPGAFSTAVTGGTLVIGSTTALGTQGLIVDSATVMSGLGEGTTLNVANDIMIGTTVGATATFDTSRGDISLDGQIAGFRTDPTDEFSQDTVKLVKAGSGTLYLSGFNSYTGGTLVEAGTLVINSDRSLGFGTRGIFLGGPNLELMSGSTLVSTDTFTLESGSGTIRLSCGVPCTDAVTIAPDADTALTIEALSGDAGLRKAGGGTLILDGENTGFTGSTEIAAGVLTIQTPTALGLGISAGSTALTIDDGATLRTDLGHVDGVDLTLKPSSFKISGSATIDTTTSTVEVQTGIADGVGGAGHLVKVGSGQLILSAVSTYTGGTAVTEGGIALGVADALPTGGALTLASGTYLDLAGHVQKSV